MRQKKRYNWKLIALFFSIFNFILGMAMIGMTFNFIVIQANGGKMPAPYSGEKWVAFSEDTKHYFLSDIIHIKTLFINSWFSIGDLIMYFAMFLMISWYIVFLLMPLKIPKKSGVI